MRSRDDWPIDSVAPGLVMRPPRQFSTVCVSISAMRCLSSITCSVWRSSVTLLTRPHIRDRPRSRRDRSARSSCRRSGRFGDLSRTLAAGVIDVIGRLGRAIVHHLPRGRAEFVLEIPLHQRQMRHPHHVAVRVIAVGLDGRIGASSATRSGSAGCSALRRLRGGSPHCMHSRASNCRRRCRAACAIVRKLPTGS